MTRDFGNEQALTLALVRKEYEALTEHWPDDYDHMEQAALNALDIRIKDWMRTKKCERPPFWKSTHAHIRAVIVRSHVDYAREQRRKLQKAFAQPACETCGDDGWLACERCNGSGEGMHEDTTCRECEGGGTVPCECQEERMQDEDDARDAAQEAKFDARRDGE